MEPTSPGARHSWPFTHDLMFTRVLYHPRAFLYFIQACIPQVYAAGIESMRMRMVAPQAIIEECIAEAAAEGISLTVLPQTQMSAYDLGCTGFVDAVVQLRDGTSVVVAAQNVGPGYQASIRWNPFQPRFLVDFDSSVQLEETSPTYMLDFFPKDPLGHGRIKYESRTVVSNGATGEVLEDVTNAWLRIHFNAQGTVSQDGWDEKCEVPVTPEIVDILKYFDTGQISGDTPVPGYLDELVERENDVTRWPDGLYPVGFSYQ